MAVLAYADAHPIGYAYGNTIEHGNRYWQRTTPPPPVQYTEHPALALKEIGVRPSWRGREPHAVSTTPSSPPAKSRT